ncbi:MAG: MtrB/PioB family outer membrane beta-barrel protein [bacterium]|nr:MtrB/PioB family outer membrane beta-barrel protein [bacterium]
MYFSDDYDQNFYGLTRYIERRAGIEVLYNVKENTTVYANYSREHYNSSLQSIAKTGVPFDIRNRWNRDDRNTNDNFGVGVSTYLYQTKWYLDVNYNFNLGRDLMTTDNLTALAPTALLNATAYDFPEAEYRYQEFSIDSNYQIFRNVALGVRYLYEPFKMDDWQLNNLSPYPVDALAPEMDGRKFLLLDSRYTSHNGHIFSVYMRFGN